MDQNGPLEASLANAKLRFGIRAFQPKWSFAPFWTILFQYTFRLYHGHSLAGTSSVNGLSCGIPYQSLHSLNALPSCSAKTFLFTDFCCVVATYCAIPRDYLSDTPPFRAMGFLVSQHGQLGAIPPPPFLSISPLESMQSGGAIPPTKGVSQRYLRDTL